MLTLLMISILIINSFTILGGCAGYENLDTNEVSNIELNEKEDLEISNSENVYTLSEREFTPAEAEVIANEVLTDNFREHNFHIIFDREVVFEPLNFFNEDVFYRFLIEDSEIALESAILVNKRTGAPYICYPDDTYKHVRDDVDFERDTPFWYGSYGKTDIEIDNHFTTLTVSKSDKGDDYLYVTVYAYHGQGAVKMRFDAKLEENKAVYSSEYEKVEIVLNSDNTLSVNITGDEELITILQGNYS